MHSCRNNTPPTRELILPKISLKCKVAYNIYMIYMIQMIQKIALFIFILSEKSTAFMQRMKKILSEDQRSTALLWISIFLLSFQVIIDTDFGWHLKVGEYIFQNKSVPKTDIISFSLPDYPYVYHSWAGELLTYLSYKPFGPIGTSIVFSVIFATAILFIYETSKLTSGGKVSSLLFAWAAYTIYPETGRGMRVFGLLFMAIVYFIYQKYKQSNSKLIWFLPLVFMLWANFHGSFVVGLFAFSILLITTRRENNANKILLFTLLLSTFASLINPYGGKVYVQALQISLNSTFLSTQNINADWYPLPRTTPHAWIIILLPATFLLFYKLLRIKIPKSQAFLTLIFLALTSLQSRFVFVLFIFFIPLANNFIQEFSKRYKQQLRETLPIKTSIITLTMILPLLITINLLQVNFAYKNLENYSIFLNRKFADKVFMPVWPYNAIESLNFYNPKELKVLTDASTSGFLLLQNPQVKLFFYGAMDNFFQQGNSFVFEYLDLIHAQNSWEDKISHYAVNTVILPPYYQLVLKLKTNSAWQLIYKDNEAAVLMKN